MLCAHQEIALRGHRESFSSKFLEILHLVASHDSVVQQRLVEGPRNAVNASAEIQNVLLHIMGEMVKKKICSDIRDAGVYSILADESKDRSKTEQLAIVITPHAQHERGKVIGGGVHYIYMFVDEKDF